ncbi:Crp/Fnr family transcriptional regulator [Solimonas terrae]|uniref:Crp/Fnr family transcriptional regulator n=1 Tax=Solimonas terrae TaxID=1396819 RepID=A0A6M2BTQ3_9GAMM|nr:Crp/Fnr family transcriptional regulator [Solimonas terrae]NGY05838.1 Crp/Fnr family transcriptional regulator [Solimonas terrae]
MRTPNKMVDPPLPGAAGDTPGDNRAAAPVARNLIEGWGWFAYVPAEARDWLAVHTSLRSIKKGKTVYISGDPATHIYGVVSGVFRIFLATPSGDEITLEEVVAGGWFPHFAPNKPPSYLANCVCQDDASVICIDQPTVEEFSQRWPAYYRGLYHEYLNRAVVIGGRIELLTLHNLRVRLAVYLLRMLRLRGQREPGGAVWLSPFESQSETGARVGGTRQRVNSVLKSWARRGYLELHKDGIRVLDIDGLGAEARKTGFDLATYLSAWHGGWQGKASKDESHI